MTSDHITLDVAGARVSIPAATLSELWLERVRRQPQRSELGLPKIGFAYPGVAGTYAGLVVADDKFATDYHLVVLNEDRPDLAWPAAIDWAKGVGGSLPKRKEQAVMFGNVPQLFEKAWYWSSEQCASGPDYAWIQYFDDGTQDYGHEVYHCRARAVRRFPI